MPYIYLFIRLQRKKWIGVRVRLLTTGSVQDECVPAKYIYVLHVYTYTHATGACW